MPVFKAYLKVIRRNIPAMLIYVGVFMFLIILLTMLYPAPPTDDFSAARPQIAVINSDADGSVAAGLTRYLNETCKIVELPDTADALQDALFFREIEYAVHIPAGFSVSLLQGNGTAKVEKSSVPDSTTAVYIDRFIEKYLATASRYALVKPKLDFNQIDSYVRADLAKESRVKLVEGAPLDYSKIAYYFNFLSYTLMALIFLGVSTIMLTFTKQDLYRRTITSPLTLMQLNGQLIFGHVLFTLIVWLLPSLASLALGDIAREGPQIALMSLNALVFAVTALSLSYLISLFVRNANVQQAIVNVLSLGSSFLGGVFVPQMLMGEAVTAIARFTPTYWYVRGNNSLDRLAADFSNIPAAYVQGVLIQIGFMAALFAVSLVVSKQRRTST